MTTLLPNYTPTTTHPTTFHLSTGPSIFSALLPQLLSTNHSLILVTCFWAPSSIQHDFHQLLLKLSERAISGQRTIHIRICFSSLSPIQKLFHTASSDGYVYPSSRYSSLGLPSSSAIPGLDIRIKSIFLRPCHVLHGKYILQDTQRVWFPSFNVSWEEWGEGSIGFEGGGLIEDIKGYWSRIWDGDGKMRIPEKITGTSELEGRNAEVSIEKGIPHAPLLAFIDFSLLPPNTKTLLLPHTHSSYNPFSIFFNPNKKTPPTPLNTFLLSHISAAKSSVSIYTPNLTYTPLINSLFDALTRGVDIRIIVSQKMMILEQLATAGTLTEWEIWKMHRRYRQLSTNLSNTIRPSDLEAQNPKLGNLDIVYFNPALVHMNDPDPNMNSPNATTERTVGASRANIKKESRPVKLHLKMTIIDNEITVLGSGNMDRASWVTSQELGVAIFSEQLSRRLVEVARSIYG